MTFEQSLEVGEGVGQVNNKGRTFQGGISSGYMVKTCLFIIRI